MDYDEIKNEEMKPEGKFEEEKRKHKGKKAMCRNRRKL